MKEKINIAELLKDCPRGMELDCILFNNPVKYESANDAGSYPISIRTEEGELFYLNKYGCLYDRFDSKCAIFPKGKTTWEGFHRPFDDGDIVATEHGLFIGIVKVKNNMQVNAYCSINDSGRFGINSTYGFERLATEEEKQKLFDAIKSNGYKWNAETKTLEKLSKFKAGDVLVSDNEEDIFRFIEQFCLIKDKKTNSYKPIKLSNIQKEFINYINKNNHGTISNQRSRNKR